jgi:hypothetical protein
LKMRKMLTLLAAVLALSAMAGIKASIKVMQFRQSYDKIPLH